MIEAEIKARVQHPDRLRALLAQRAPVHRETYHDTYYERPGGGLAAEDRELRLRVITSEAGHQRAVLTYKEPRVDEITGSKPEYETDVAAPEAMAQILTRLGYTVLIVFAKHCENHRFTAHGRPFLATLVTVPELDGTFLELETPADENDLTDALAAVNTTLVDLGITPADHTTATYTDAVAAAQR